MIDEQNDQSAEEQRPDLTFHADSFHEFIDEDVKDDPELRMKSPPVIPIIVHPDSLPGLDRK